MTPESHAPGQVAIILVNWNGWRDAIECLSSVFASDASPAFDVYLVDNASSDGSVGRITDWCAAPMPLAAYSLFDGVRHVGSAAIACRVWQADGRSIADPSLARLHIVRAGSNLGFAGGNNVGLVAAGLARYSHFWLLNTDTVVRHDALGYLLQRARASADVGMVGSTLRYYHEPHLIQALGGAVLNERTATANHIGDRRLAGTQFDSATEVEQQMNYVVGASMFVSSRFVQRVGPMQEDYFLYYEEVDWAFRGRPEFKLGYAPLSIVYHKVGGSSTQVISTYSLNVLYRNRVRFASRFLPASLPSVRRMLALEVARHVLKGRWTPARLAARTLRDSGRLAASAPPQATRSDHSKTDVDD